MTKEITLTQAYDRLVAIARANAKNAETVLLLTEILHSQVARLEAENEELKRRQNENPTDP